MPRQSNYRVVYQNPIFEVGEFEVEFEGGLTKTFSKIVKQDTVVIVPVTDDDQVVFIREYHAAVNETFLTLPGGRVDTGEEPVKSARRELMEETGYRTSNLVLLAELLMTPGYLEQVSYGYLATGLTKETQNLEQSEVIEVELHGLDAIDELIRRKELREARDIALCLLARQKVRGND
jgi:ADP-ribose pyrophosphatase